MKTLIDRAVNNYLGTTKKKLPKANNPVYPMASEKEMYWLMKSLINETKKELKAEIEKQISTQTNLDSLRQDSLDDWLSNLSTYKNLVDRVFNKQLVRRLLTATQAGVMNHNKRQVKKSFEKFVGIDLLEFSDDVVDISRLQTENSLAMISDLSTDIKEKIEKQVFRGMREGLRHEQLAKRIKSSLTGGKKGIFKSVENRAKLIARNETSTFNANLTKRRNENLGIKFYRWVTAQDNRVRDDGGEAGAKNHVDLHGKIFPWGDNSVTYIFENKKYKFKPAPKGLFGQIMFPGNEINCRCRARSIIDIEMNDIISNLSKNKTPAEVVSALQ